MKVSFDEVDNSAYIEFMDDTVISTDNSYKYLKYHRNSSGELVGIQIDDVESLGIDIVRVTYMTENNILEYLEELRSTQ